MFAAEVWIALYVHDDLVRPWGGDVLEALQYFHILGLLGLEDNAVARMVVWTTFSWLDTAGYTLGIVFVPGSEWIIDKRHAV
jgi:hypothetical protein